MDASASASTQYTSPMTSKLREDHRLYASDFDLLAFAHEAGTIPDTKHDEQREAAIEALCKAVDASRERDAGLTNMPYDEAILSSSAQWMSSVKLVLIPVGSYGMKLHFPDSDIDCIVVGNITPATFWKIVQRRLCRHMLQANGIHDQPPIVLKRFIYMSNEQTMVLSAGEFRFNIQYHSEPIWAENCSRIVSSVDDDISLRVSSLKILNTYRDQIRLQDSMSSFSSFQLAYRLIKLLCIRRGLYAPQFGFLGGMHLVVMLRRLAEGLPDPPSTFELIKEFFHIYGSFHWESEIVSVPDVDKAYRQSTLGPMIILSSQRPATNVAASATFFTRQTIIKEFLLAHEKLLAGMPFTQICTSETCALSNFIDGFDYFVKVDVSYWGGSCTIARALLGYVELRIRELLVNLHEADHQATVRLWPERLTASQSTTDGETSSVQGFYLLGCESCTLTCSLEPLIGILRVFEQSVRENAPHFDTSVCYFAVETCRRADIEKCGNVGFDRPVWRDDGIDDSEAPEMEEDEEATARGGASPWKEAGGDLDRQEYVVNQSASKKQRGGARNASAAQCGPAEKLRTSADVYNRLLWDPRYDAGVDYLIGYEDRFLGIKEMPLRNWSREVEDETFIPFHRVVHFRHKSTGEVVWDRRTRVDRVFGSDVIRPPNCKLTSH